MTYQETGLINGFRTAQKDRLGINHLGLDIGYRHNVRKIGLFGYAGAGVASVDVPQLRVNVPMQQIDFESVTGSFLNLRTGAGAEYGISPLFIPYVEMACSYIPFKTPLNNRPISGVTFLIGFRTPFQ